MRRPPPIGDWRSQVRNCCHNEGMPPRFAYWTILIDGNPTAFRAKEQEELLPTLNQLKKKNKDVVLRWFARGQLWDSPDAALLARQRPQNAPEKRNADWRPGGAHKDPRDRFKKKNRPERAWSDKEPPPGGARKPWGDAPGGPPRGDRPWQNRPPAAGQSDRPWQVKPTGPRSQRTWQNKPPAGGKPWGGKPAGAGEHDRSARRSSSGPGPSGGGWSGQPSGPPRGDRPWQNKPPGGHGHEGRRSSSGPGPSGGGWSGKPTGPRKRRDDEPPDRK